MNGSDAATGYRRMAKKRKKAAAQPALTGRPVIVVNADEHLVNDQTVEALASDPTVYQRGGQLVQVVTDAEEAALGVRRPPAPRIVPLSQSVLRDRMARSARFVSGFEGKDGSGPKQIHPPAWCVASVLDRGQWPGIRPLLGVVDHPVLRRDGSILAEPGYDHHTGLLHMPTGTVEAVPEKPTKADAKLAAAELLEAVADFPFACSMHKAAWLAALLTPLARFAFDGPAPLFLVDANVRGVGKSLLLQVISHILTGKHFAVASYTDDEAELRKHITSLALAGDRTVLFDNVEGKFGNSTLDRALTGTTWQDRLLSLNKTLNVPLNVTWYATGNNLSPVADTSRRICHIRLESKAERPEERQDFAHPNLLTWIKENRSRLLRAALTILRAYVVADPPDQELTPWGSFEGWSDLVRSAVRWAGLLDPGETRQYLREQADHAQQSLIVLLRCWKELDKQGDGLTVNEVVSKLTPGPFSGLSGNLNEMRDAVESLTGKVDSRTLGILLRRKRRTPAGGLFIDRAGKDHNAIRWRVYDQDEF